MTRGDGTTYDTDAHVEWGYVLDDWPQDGMTSFIGMDSEAEARQVVSTLTGKRLAYRAVDRVIETA